MNKKLFGALAKIDQIEAECVDWVDHQTTEGLLAMMDLLVKECHTTRDDGDELGLIGFRLAHYGLLRSVYLALAKLDASEEKGL